MVYGAIDLHLRISDVRVIDADGRVVRQRRVPTRAADLVAAFAGLGPVRILVESGTESEWVAETLEAMGAEVIVADPNFAPMYGDLSRKVKTNDRDVAALAAANRQGWYRPAYRTSATQRAVRQQLRARRQLIQMRSGTISLIRSLVRQHGVRVPSGSSDNFVARLGHLTLPPGLTATLAPLTRVLATLTTEIVAGDEALETIAKADPVVRRLATARGVGPIVALSYRAFIDRVERFGTAGQVSAAIGLVPREDSSADRRHRGHITKAGPAELRSLLVQAAWSCWRTSRGPLRRWVEQLAARRGKRIAVVALARRLSRILFAMWRDQTVFDEFRVAA